MEDFLTKSRRSFGNRKGEEDDTPFEMLDTSIDQFINQAGLSFDRPTNTLFQAAIRATIFNQTRKMYFALESASGKCESPIEEIMLAALVLACNVRGIDFRIKHKIGKTSSTHTNTFLASEWDGVTDLSDVLLISINTNIGKYRADFLVEEVQTWDRMTMKNGKLVKAGEVQHECRVVVECDGHDYHERTKAQASHDKKRDRALQSLGYKVYRYTGSDIHADPLVCALEVIDLIINERYAHDAQMGHEATRGEG